MCVCVCVRVCIKSIDPVSIIYQSIKSCISSCTHARRSVDNDDAGDDDDHDHWLSVVVMGGAGGSQPSLCARCTN